MLSPKMTPDPKRMVALLRGGQVEKVRREKKKKKMHRKTEEKKRKRNAARVGTDGRQVRELVQMNQLR